MPIVRQIAGHQVPADGEDLRQISARIAAGGFEDGVAWIEQLRTALNVFARWCKLSSQERTMDTLLVSRDPEVMSGALCFRGTRVPVKTLFDYLEGSSTLEDFLEDFPSISRATAVSVLEVARERLALDATAA